VQLVQPSQHLDRLRRRLTEVRTGIEHQLLELHAPIERERDPLAQEPIDILEHATVELWIEKLLLGCGTSVHQHERGAGLGTDVSELGVAQATDVVDDRRSRGDRRPRYLRLVGVDGHPPPELAADPADQRHHALDLLPGLDRRTVGDAGFPTDVDQLGAGR
jgi:hypothetical protein